MRVNYAIIFVSDMQRAVSFYQDGLGLPLRFESPEWTQFATDGATLALHASKRPASDEDDPQEVPAGRYRPGLSVPNLDAFLFKDGKHGFGDFTPSKKLIKQRLAHGIGPSAFASTENADAPGVACAASGRRRSTPLFTDRYRQAIGI